ncbi:phenylalanine--tRNA ligase subunit beta [Candidatus Saccharibacteria bacterium]|nr:phenylalanine--tRNA ligase subunit beta [Candidatus Saccharibacteria bacterium]
MKVSLNWVRKFTEVSIPSHELIEKIGAQLGAVDEVIELGEKYSGAVVVKVIECEKHPNADKLSLCLIDDGGKAKKVDRDSRRLVQVVCGAPNIAAGQLVVWLPPGMVVPNTFDKDPFTLEAREIRGSVSNGMIASAKELAIGDDHTGIVVIKDGIEPGTSLLEAFSLDDVIIDIENKMFTHRPDCFGMLGIAREIAGIQGKAFKSPSWYTEHPGNHVDGRKTVLELAVKNELPKLVPRFCTVAIKDIRVEASPLWLQTYLARVGVRPINNIVDLTNYLMLETGQPLHAYDYDKVQKGGKATIGIREAREGEELILLGGKQLKLRKGSIVITDGKVPIGLGGVMGGQSTEVDDKTKNIIIEVANFDMNTTRRTAMTYGLFTDAATRFTKGQSPRQNMAVICLAIEKTKLLAGGRVASKVVDDKHIDGRHQSVKVGMDFINQRLGTDLSATQAKKLLQNVEFEVTATHEQLEVSSPFWRTDIEIAEDIVEEVGRLYGYDRLPHTLPLRSIKPTQLDHNLSFKSRVREILSAAGANEALTYSFVHGSLLASVGQNQENAYQIRNALSPDLQYYRLSLVPSLLEKVHPNIKSGYDEFIIYELNKSHEKGRQDEGEPSLPKEIQSLALVVAAKDKTHKEKGAAYYQARNYLDHLANTLGIELDYLPIDTEFGYPAAKPFDHKRSALVLEISSGNKLGLIGEFKNSVIDNMKLPNYSAGFEIDIEALQKSAKLQLNYEPLNRYPSVDQDLCLRTSADLPYGELNGFLVDMLGKASQQHGYKHKIEPIDIFQRPEDKEHKQTTWHISIAHPERTLTTEEVNQLFDKISDEAKKQLKAERV